MQLLYSLSWLWQSLGICLAAVLLCLGCAALICRLRGKRLGKKAAILLSAAALLAAILLILRLAQTPMPI